jgi:hypothetical protein
MKDEANRVYYEQRYDEALELYVQALAASNFGGKKSIVDEKMEAIREEEKTAEASGKNQEGDGKGGEEEEDLVDDSIDAELAKLPALPDVNIDSLVLPVLSNMAACCIQQQRWGKAIQFCKQVLALRPGCVRALIRFGQCEIARANYTEARKLLMLAVEANDKVIATAPKDSEIRQTAAADAGRIKILEKKTLDGEHRQQLALARRKESLQRAFRQNSQNSAVPVIGLAGLPDGLDLSDCDSDVNSLDLDRGLGENDAMEVNDDKNAQRAVQQFLVSATEVSHYPSGLLRRVTSSAIKLVCRVVLFFLNILLYFMRWLLRR